MYYMDWYKSPSDKYDEPRMRYLRCIENGNTYALILDMLYALAARQNEGGRVSLNSEIPFDSEILGCVLGFDEATMSDALDALEICAFIERDQGRFIHILDWSRTQFEAWQDDKTMRDQKEKKKEKNQKKEIKETRVKEQEQEQKQEQKQELEREAEAEAERAAREREESDCTAVLSLFGSICSSYPQIEILSRSQKKAIKRLINQISIEKVRLVFERAEESTFLKSSGWATFDWLIRVDNAIKVMNGNYRDDTARERDVNGGTDRSGSTVGELSSFDDDEFIAAALNRGFD